jgi:hypothetical protein
MPPTRPKQVEYIVNDSGTRFFFAENEEQLDKILAVRNRCPELVRIFVFDMEGLHAYRDDQVMSFEALLELGAAYQLEHIGIWDKLVEIAQPEDLAILVYTSGTTGPPKGAMLSHSNILFQLGYADLIARVGEGDEQLSFLPLCHVAERTVSVFYPLESAATVNFAESPDTVPENIREVGPALFFAVPRIWEKFYSGVALRVNEATPLANSPIAGRSASGGAWPTIAFGDAARGPTEAALCGRRLSGARQHPPFARTATGARRGHWCRADRAGADQMVHGARHRPARDLRPDRELRSGDECAPRSDQARHRWDRSTRHRTEDFARRRDPAKGAARLHRLLQ